MSKEKISSLIIDDDPFMQDLLSDKLRQHVPEVEVLSKASCGEEGIEMIEKHKPDLIFLDVEMLDMTGFEMLSKIKSIDFEIIFITSYSHYAVKAIRSNALDYLIKPIDLGELKTAIESYKSRSTSMVNVQAKKEAVQNLTRNNIADQYLFLQTQEGELQLALEDIIRIEGERNYSFIHLRKSKKKLVSKTLADLEFILEKKGFFRCHKSHIVNAQHIISVANRLNISLSDDAIVPISRRKKDDFKLWFENCQITNN